MSVVGRRVKSLAADATRTVDGGRGYMRSGDYHGLRRRARVTGGRGHSSVRRRFSAEGRIHVDSITGTVEKTRLRRGSVASGKRRSALFSPGKSVNKSQYVRQTTRSTTRRTPAAFVVRVSMRLPSAADNGNRSMWTSWW